MVCDEVAQSPVLPQAKCAQKAMKVKTHRRVHCMKVRTFRHKYRCCTNLRGEDFVFLRQSAGLSDDETVCLLIDDSLLMKGTKNVVFTDKRIL